MVKLKAIKINLAQDIMNNIPKEKVQTLSFGVRYLDVATGGIAPNDVVLVTARTGAGKTEFCTNLAVKNAEAGKKILMFALEAEEGEIGKRIAYRLASRAYFDRSKLSRPTLETDFRYPNFYLGNLSGSLKQYEPEILEKAKAFENVSIIYRRKNFSAEDFCRLLMMEEQYYDMFILDHLSYLDLPDDAPENKSVTEMIKMIRDTALLTSRPVVMVSHLRKKDRKDRGLVPDIEDVYGSSNIYKMATKCVVVAPDFSSGLDKPKTYFHIAKCRVDGSLTRYLGHVGFSRDDNSYEDGFGLGKFYPGIENFEMLIGAEVPKWVPQKTFDNGFNQPRPPEVTQ